MSPPDRNNAGYRPPPAPKFPTPTQGGSKSADPAIATCKNQIGSNQPPPVDDTALLQSRSARATHIPPPPDRLRAHAKPPAMRPTQALSVGRYRHLKLTTKDVGRGFYKGNRTGSMGRHTKYGGYVIEWNKVRTYSVPDLKDFKLTPFVSRQIKAQSGDYKGLEKGPQDPYFYVEQWKRYNGVD
ncbi:50S ribosomal protein YmL27 [Purpureocillium lavendulum]|uniref:50S ribosomal protein YmL27 n=1 Tax=Purpureocillium lavendulum TaxID=1247861 RepID=A0AB34FSK4_9HYPO|nr:50S ribosomal protein YmL27 [Purpureocillium lavendulum]